MEKSPLTVFSGLKRRRKKKERWRAAFKKWASSRRRENLQQPVTAYNRYSLSAKEIVLYELSGITACMLISYVYYRNLKIFFCLLPFGIIYPWYKKKNLIVRRLEKLSSEFKEGITVLSSSLTAGYSIENAFRVSLDELRLLYGESSLIVREFQYIVSQLGMNRPVEQLLFDFGKRSGIEDIENFAEVFAAAKRSGGGLSSIMEHTAGVIRDRMEVKEEIRTMTAARRFEQRIMNLLPYLIVFYIEMASPGFFRQMYTTGLGRILMTACLAVYLSAFAIAEKILDIEI